MIAACFPPIKNIVGSTPPNAVVSLAPAPPNRAVPAPVPNAAMVFAPVASPSGLVVLKFSFVPPVATAPSPVPAAAYDPYFAIAGANEGATPASLPNPNKAALAGPAAPTI